MRRRDRFPTLVLRHTRQGEQERTVMCEPPAGNPKQKVRHPASDEMRRAGRQLIGFRGGVHEHPRNRRYRLKTRLETLIPRRH